MRSKLGSLFRAWTNSCHPAVAALVLIGIAFATPASGLTVTMLPDPSNGGTLMIEGETNVVIYADGTRVYSGILPGVMRFIRAIANSPLHFSRWDDGGVGAVTMPTTNRQQIMITGNYVIVASFRYYLTVNNDGHGTTVPTGKIETPPGSYSLSATPNADYAFSNWTGSTVDFPTSALTDIQMNGDKTVQANFQAVPVIVSLSVTNPAAPGSAPQSIPLTTGSLYTVAVGNPAVYPPAVQYRWQNDGWDFGTGDIPASGAFSSYGPYAVSQNSAIRWHWLKQWPLFIDTNGNGTVQWPYVGGTNWVSESLSPITITAIPSPDCAFLEWTGDTNSTNPALTLPASNRTWYVKANFRGPFRSLCVREPGGPGSIGYVTNLPMNSTFTVAITNATVEAGGPGCRYTSIGWADGSGDIPVAGGVASYGPYLVQANSGITWQWARQWELTVAVDGGGTVQTPYAPGVYWVSQGANVTLVAVPRAGYLLTSWTGDTAGCVAAGSQLTVPMTGVRQIEARFQPVTGALLRVR